MLRLIQIFAAIILCASCSDAPNVIELSGKTMGTTYNVTIVDHSREAKHEALHTLIDETLIEVNETFSNWDPKSEVSLFDNAQSGEWVSISPEFQRLVEVSNEIHSQSDGYYDATIGPLVKLWGFFEPGAEHLIPSDEVIAQTREQVGQMAVISFDKAAGKLRKEISAASFQTAAIAKGTGIDAVANALSAAGQSHFMVEIGGDLVTKGRNAHGQDWRIGIERPRAGDRGLAQIVTISDLGMATSGDYRIYFEQDGVRYSHIIDPKTGRPVTHKTASVTVIAENAERADAWATALLSAGSERGLPMAQAHGIRALFIDRAQEGAHMDFVTTATPGFTALQAANQD